MKRQGLNKLFTTGVLATSLLAASATASAQNIFLKIDGVTGESQDDKHKGSIDILSWSWGASTGTGKTKRGVQPPACIQDLNVMKQTDSGTPDLIMNSVTGEVAQSAVMSVRKSGGDQQEFLTLTMKNVTVVSFQASGSEQGGLPTESLTLHFESMQGAYRKQKADGSLEPAITWDIVGGNAACQQ
jgi:type VI secretion system secreted protein Hcp